MRKKATQHIDIECKITPPPILRWRASGLFAHAKIGTLLSLSLCATLIAGCSSTDFRDIRKPDFQDSVASRIEAGADQTKPNFVIRAGDSITQSLTRLSQITGTIYIIDKDDDTTRHVELTAQSQPITNWADMENYLEALGYTAELSPVGAAVNEPVRPISGEGLKKSGKQTFCFPSPPPPGYVGIVPPPCPTSSASEIADKAKPAAKPFVRGGYARVSIRKIEARARVKASSASCRVHLVGALPMGPVISDICRASGATCSYVDAGASAYTGVVYPMSFEGNCADALEYVGQKADLAVNFTDNQVEFKMMETATIDLGIPLRDRKVALDIIASTSGNGNGTSQGTTNSATTTDGSTASSSVVGSGKSLQSGYQTHYLQSVRAVLESMRTPFGTWNYLPETGQIFIRDRAEAVDAIRNALNRMAQTFQSRFSVTITLYRVNMTGDVQVSSSLIRQINNQLSMQVGIGSAIADPQGVFTYSGKKTQSVIKVLSTLGNIETLDNYTLNLQAGIPQTLKIAHNTEYVRNISTTTVASSSSVSSSVEQANATDGSFLTVQARQAEAGKIAVDYGVFINQLEGFDTTQTSTATVKSQLGFERTFDTASVVEDGVPYVSTLVSNKSRNDTQSSVPGLDRLGFIGALLGGDKTDSTANSYIAVVVEAVRQ